MVLVPYRTPRALLLRAVSRAFTCYIPLPPRTVLRCYRLPTFPFTRTRFVATGPDCVPRSAAAAVLPPVRVSADNVLPLLFLVGLLRLPALPTFPCCERLITRHPTTCIVSGR